MILWLSRFNSPDDRCVHILTSSVVFLIFPFTIFLVYSYLPPANPLLVNDSAAYMYFDPTRPIGYPIFLYILKHTSGSYEGLRYVQLAILCISVYVSAIALFQYSGRLLIPLLFQLGALGHPGLILLTDWISRFALFLRLPALHRCGFLLWSLAIGSPLRDRLRGIRGGDNLASGQRGHGAAGPTAARVLSSER